MASDTDCIGENIEIVPKKPSKYFVNVGEADVQNAIQQFYSDRFAFPL